jgi:hypothetical protein
MRPVSFNRRAGLIAFFGLLAALVIGVSLGSTGGDSSSAPPAVLNHIAHKNQDAAVDAAARMKAKSDATSRAAEARANAIEPVVAADLGANAANAQ